MRIHLKVWRQAGPERERAARGLHRRGRQPRHVVPRDARRLNEGLIAQRRGSVAFDSDCREGICGACGFLIDGVAHGPDPGTTVCQLHMRRFNDGDTIDAGAVARARLPGHQGPGRRPQRLRSDHPGGRLHVGQRRRGAGRQRDSDCEAHRRTGDGLGGLHRLRRLRRGVQERLGGACSPRPRSATSALLPQGQVERHARVVAMVRSPRRGRLRQLLQRGRVRSRLPERDSDHQHRPDEPGLLPGDVGFAGLKLSCPFTG